MTDLEQRVAAPVGVAAEDLGDWEPAPDRPDPLEVVAADEAGRIPELLPLRHERMVASPYAFYRATASLFALDQAHLPRSGLQVQLSGDAHLANFGIYRAPDRALVFDLNDFDETLPGPFEWDLRRLAASIELAGRDRGFSAGDRAEAVEEGTGAYFDGLAEFAAMHHLDLWYYRLTVDDIRSRWEDETPGHMARRLKEAVSKARGKDRLKAMRKLTVTGDDGRPRFRGDLPTLTPLRDLAAGEAHEQAIALFEASLRSYRGTLTEDRQLLLDRYRFVDLARRVGGVGSVATRCWIALLVGDSAEDPLVLQVKEAGRSVLEPHLGRCAYPECGQRVVEGQRRIQSSTDVFLGWEQLLGEDGLGHDYYFRQLWDGKGSVDLEEVTPGGLELYAMICGHSLARAHARTGDGRALAAFASDRRAVAAAMCSFASRYADRVEADHAAFAARVAPG